MTIRTKLSKSSGGVRSAAPSYPFLPTPSATFLAHSNDLPTHDDERNTVPIPQFLPSIRDSETVTCPRCSTRQYPKNGSCIRCQCTLNIGYLTLEISAALESSAENPSKQLAHLIGDLLRKLRNGRGICQSQMARMAAGLDRSYLSKAENGLALLPLTKLLPLAQALGLTAVILRFEEPRSRAVFKRRRPR